MNRSGWLVSSTSISVAVVVVFPFLSNLVGCFMRHSKPCTISKSRSNLPSFLWGLSLSRLRSPMSLRLLEVTPKYKCGSVLPLAIAGMFPLMVQAVGKDQLLSCLSSQFSRPTRLALYTGSDDQVLISCMGLWWRWEPRYYRRLFSCHYDITNN